MNADRTADWTPGERLAAILAQEINDAPAEELIQAAVDDVLRGWAARIRETGTAKGWGTWAAEYMDPDVAFDETAMPSTETIVAELRRLDCAAMLRETAERLLDERRHHVSRAIFCDGITYASDRLTQWADESEREKDTSGGAQPSAGESTADAETPQPETGAGAECLFCDTASAANRVIARQGLAYTRLDNYPAAPGHLEIVPVRHVVSVLDLTPAEVADCHTLLRQMAARTGADGYTIGVNEGRAAGRTVDHVHIHVIPRYAGDVADPRGGVRNVLPGSDPDRWTAPQPAAADTDRIVAYSPGGRTLRCLNCRPNPLGSDWQALTAEGLEYGGICTACGVDVLIADAPSHATNDTAGEDR